MPAEAHINIFSRFVFLFNVFLGNHADPDEMPYSESTFSFLCRLGSGVGLAGNMYILDNGFFFGIFLHDYYHRVTGLDK